MHPSRELLGAPSTALGHLNVRGAETHGANSSLFPSQPRQGNWQINLKPCERAKGKRRSTLSLKASPKTKGSEFEQRIGTFAVAMRKTTVVSWQSRGVDANPQKAKSDCPVGHVGWGGQPGANNKRSAQKQRPLNFHATLNPQRRIANTLRKCVVTSFLVHKTDLKQLRIEFNGLPPRALVLRGLLPLPGNATF